MKLKLKLSGGFTLRQRIFPEVHFRWFRSKFRGRDFFGSIPRSRVSKKSLRHTKTIFEMISLCAKKTHQRKIVAHLIMFSLRTISALFLFDKPTLSLSLSHKHTHTQAQTYQPPLPRAWVAFSTATAFPLGFRNLRVHKDWDSNPCLHQRKRSQTKDPRITNNPFNPLLKIKLRSVPLIANVLSQIV